MTIENYHEKFRTIRAQTLFDRLSSQDQKTIENIATEYRFTFQELKKFIEWQIDLLKWQESSAIDLWQALDPREIKDLPMKKKTFFSALEKQILQIRSKPKRYEQKLQTPFIKKSQGVALVQSDAKVFGQCPVASEKTVCCNLYTIDAVKNCGFNCSYCSIQTLFADQDIQFDQDFAKKITALDFSPDRFYHVGTGQSSDALMWGNRNGILDTLIGLARKNPNILLEFKTKSNNVSYFLENEVPENIVCSWSLNPQIIIENEEHLTASLTARLEAALKVAKRGIKVAFHFHPMIFFENWQQQYRELFELVLTKFRPEQVAFISFGSLTFPRPVINKVRNYSYATKILQMEMAENPEGKLTYPISLKKEMFSLGYQSFSSWHNQVYFYLCMEPKELWTSVFGKVYNSNAEFESDFASQVMPKLKTLSGENPKDGLFLKTVGV